MGSGLHDVDPGRLRGVKGYDSHAIRADLTKRGIDPVIPPRSSRKAHVKYDHEAYKRRNLIERCVNGSSSFVVLQRVTKKLPEPTFQCYASQPQGSG
jgi:hypothetical protein